MSTTILPRALALTLAFGFASTAMLSAAHATNGRTAATACIYRDDCSISINPNGSFTIVLDGGGVIWCPDLKGQCVVVSPDTGKVGQQPPVAAPISKTPVAAAPGNPKGGSPAPVVNHPAPPRQINGLPVVNHPAPPRQINGLPVIFHPSPVLHKPIIYTPIKNPSAPVILVRSSRSSGHGNVSGHGHRR